jgi:hypothetical protein
MTKGKKGKTPPGGKRMGGRPRSATAKRHPSGQVYRRSDAETERDVVSVNREARQRRYGISHIEATQPEWGSVLGRLYKLGDITKPQLEAGHAYAQMRSDYDRVMMARSVPSGSDFDRQHGFDGSEATQEYLDWAARIRQLHERCLLALMATMDLRATAAIERAAVEDKPLTRNLIGSLRLALNAVGKVLR